jgi:hypothetical protein
MTDRHEFSRPLRDHLNDLVIVPDDASVLAQLDRMIDRAMSFRATVRVLFADDECEHGGLPADREPQPGCTPECPGYPAAKRVAVVEPPKRGRYVGRELHRICRGCGAHFTQKARQGRPFSYCDNCRSQR